MNTVMQEFLRELQRLEEMKQLYMQIPLQEIGKELDMPLGATIGVNILPRIKKMKEELEALRVIVGAG